MATRGLNIGDAPEVIVSAVIESVTSPRARGSQAAACQPINVRHKWAIRGVAIAICVLFLSGCKESVRDDAPSGAARTASTQDKKQTLPAQFFLKATAERGLQGEVIIEGSTNLPDTMKIGVQVVVQNKRRPLPGYLPYTILDDDFSIVISQGRFRSPGLMPFRTHKPFPPGNYAVHFISVFNEVWQSPDILALVGPGGKKLHGKMFQPRDPDVVDSDLGLDYPMTLYFPPLSKEARAIALVKEAVLEVPGLGRSSTNVEGGVQWFMSSPGLKPAKGWSAKRLQGDSYTVSYDFFNGEAGEEQAIWGANLATTEVRYINKNAKSFSWIPKD